MTICCSSTEVKCHVPEIENGFLLQANRVYKQDEYLSFQCDPKYKPTDKRPPRCIKTGMRAEWSPTPACERK